MSQIQKTLDSLQPYVIGIRYLEGVAVVDTVFKEGWTVPEDPSIKKVKGNDEMNYFMIFSEVEGVGLDELLAYVARTINLNQDREKKHDLLRTKVNELKEVFKKNTFAKLTTLKFTFGEEDMMPSINELDEEPTELEGRFAIEKTESVVDEPEEEEIIESIKPIIKVPETYLDENKKPIELTDEDREILAEEARAERNRKVIEAKKQNPEAKILAKKIELPPKRKIEMVPAEKDYESDCECGPDEACSRCIDKKGY